MSKKSTLSVASTYPEIVEKTTLKDNLALVNVKKTLDLVNNTIVLKRM